MSEKFAENAERVARAEKSAFEAAYSALSGADYDETARAVSIALEAYRSALPTPHVVFDSFPSAVAPRFIEVEDGQGNSISFGEWRARPDGLVELVFPK